MIEQKMNKRRAVIDLTNRNIKTKEVRDLMLFLRLKGFKNVYIDSDKGKYKLCIDLVKKEVKE